LLTEYNYFFTMHVAVGMFIAIKETFKGEYEMDVNYQIMSWLAKWWAVGNPHHPRLEMKDPRFKSFARYDML
jgi:hypothetical protein